MTTVLIIGGGSGMGLALARAALDEGMAVTIAGRGADRLNAARAELEPAARDRLGTATVDIAREEDVARLFARPATGEQGAGHVLGDVIDHVVVTAADATGVYGRTAEVATSVARAIVDTKLLGAWLVAKHAAGRVTGSITFTSGINAYRPNGANTIMAAANGALASLAYGLAIELAPVRVNVVSPGWVDTGIWDQLGMDKRAAFADMAERLPARRVGTPADIAQAFLSVLRNGFMTGTVLHVDGGHRLT
jgi:NAD(P)-dependent dehydrogenase (short-subunit alcohol dehydrogenase family)